MSRLSWTLGGLTVLTSFALAVCGVVQAQQTSWTYQGEIRDDGVLASGPCDLRFTLWDSDSGGNQLAPEETFSSELLAQGRFTVNLDFGVGAFDGSARWLEIEAACPSGSAFESLSPRQPLTSAPQALFAAHVPWSGIDNPPPGLDDGDDIDDDVQFSEISSIVGPGSSEVAVGNHLHDVRYYTQMDLQQSGGALVHWDNLDQVPTGIADGDDDTTYAAGGGLTLSATTFAVDTSAIQARVDGVCGAGQAIRAVNADGTVECDDSSTALRHAAPRDNRLTTVDSFGWAGDGTAIAIGVDGFPIIAEYDGINQDLRVVHCNDVACAGAADITTVDQTDNVGQEPDLAITPDGLAVVSYYDGTNGNLKVAHCQNVACTAFGTTAVDQTSDDVGRWSAVTIGADGLPLISYYDSDNKDLKVAHCSNTTCTGTPQINTIDSTGDVGWHTAIAAGIDGQAWISYFDNSNDDL